MSAFLDGALATASDGLKVFPLSVGTKITLARSNGFKDASDDPDRIRSWWADNPNCNVGVATYGHLVVDIDTGNGKIGAESWNMLSEGREITTRAQRTCHGGTQLFFRLPVGKSYTSSNSKLAKDVDIKTGGPYVVGAPSYVTDCGRPGCSTVHKAYEWLNDHPITEVPEWLDRILELPPPTAKAGEGFQNQQLITLTVEEHRRGEKFLNQRLAEIRTRLANLGVNGWQGEPWDQTCWQCACDLVTLAHGAWNRLTLETAEEMFFEWAPQDEGFTERTLTLKWYSALRAKEGEFVPLPGAPFSADEAGGQRRVRLTPASAITPKRVRWLWKGRLPLGALAMTVGPVSLGKSTFHSWLIAQVTKGELPGELFGKPRGAAIAASEESWESVIVPRLMAAEADLDRVFRIDVETSDLDENTRLSLPADIPELIDQIKQHDIALISCDPLISLIDGSKDTHKNADVRAALEPIIKLGDQTSATVLGNGHLNKASGSNAVSRVTGSAAFTEVARVVIAFAADEEGAVLSVVKNNLGRTDQSIKFVVDTVRVQVSDGVSEVGKFTSQGDSDRTADDILTASNRPGPKSNKLQDAEDWVTEYINMHGPSTRPDITNAGMQVGHSKATLSRALSEGPFVTERNGFQAPTTYGLK